MRDYPAAAATGPLGALLLHSLTPPPLALCLGHTLFRSFFPSPIVLCVLIPLSRPVLILSLSMNLFLPICPSLTSRHSSSSPPRPHSSSFSSHSSHFIDRCHSHPSISSSPSVRSPGRPALSSPPLSSSVVVRQMPIPSLSLLYPTFLLFSPSLPPLLFHPADCLPFLPFAGPLSFIFIFLIPLPSPSINDLSPTFITISRSLLSLSRPFPLSLRSTGNSYFTFPLVEWGR